MLHFGHLPQKPIQNKQPIIPITHRSRIWYLLLSMVWTMEHLFQTGSFQVVGKFGEWIHQLTISPSRCWIISITVWTMEQLWKIVRVFQVVRKFGEWIHQLTMSPSRCCTTSMWPSELWNIWGRLLAYFKLYGSLEGGKIIFCRSHWISSGESADWCPEKILSSAN